MASPLGVMARRDGGLQVLVSFLSFFFVKGYSCPGDLRTAH